VKAIGRLGDKVSSQRFHVLMFKNTSVMLRNISHKNKAVASGVLEGKLKFKRSRGVAKHHMA
jgi:hypothetical protein